MFEIRKTERTYTVQIYMAGSLQHAAQHIRRYVFDLGWCVTITPTTFIYTGGEEDGFVIGCLNYPRFPTPDIETYRRAKQLATELMDFLGQKSALLVAIGDISETEWLNRQPPAPKDGRSLAP